jgi:hypothetical protein
VNLNPPAEVQADYDLRNRLKRGEKRREVHLRGSVFVADYDDGSSFGTTPPFES